MKGTKVKHRADPTGRAMIVTSDTVVATSWIEEGEACADHFEPEELEVVEGAGLLTGGVDLAADGSSSITVWTTTRLDGGAGPAKTTTESPWGQWVVAGEVVQRAAQHEELGPLCKGCSRAPEEGNACDASRGAQKTIGGDGVTRCAAFDLVASGKVFDGFDPGRHTIDASKVGVLCLSCRHIYRNQKGTRNGVLMCHDGRPLHMAGSEPHSCEAWHARQEDAEIDPDPCSYCAHHHPDDGILCSADQGPTISAGGCDRFVALSGHRKPKAPDDFKPSDADLADAIDSALCLACDHWPPQTLDGQCGTGKLPRGPDDSCGDWIRTEPPAEDHEPRGDASMLRSFGELALADELESRGWAVCGPGDDVPEQIDALGSRITTIREELLRRADANELAAELTRRGMVVVSPADLPDRTCYTCEHWDSEQPDPCLKSMLHDMADVDKGPCGDYEQRWEDIAKHLSKQVAGGDLEENPHLDPGVRRELDEAKTTDGPRPTKDLDTAPFAEQLDWLRDNGYPVPIKTGRKDRAPRLLLAIRVGLYREGHAEVLWGPLKWPVTPEPAKCPECESETPEDCECELP